MLQKIRKVVVPVFLAVSLLLVAVGVASAKADDFGYGYGQEAATGPRGCFAPLLRWYQLYNASDVGGDVSKIDNNVPYLTGFLQANCRPPQKNPVVNWFANFFATNYDTWVAAHPAP